MLRVLSCSLEVELDSPRYRRWALVVAVCPAAVEEEEALRCCRALLSLLYQAL
jgi:hypothetical protein